MAGCYLAPEVLLFFHMVFFSDRIAGIGCWAFIMVRVEVIKVLYIYCVYTHAFSTYFTSLKIELDGVHVQQHRCSAD